MVRVFESFSMQLFKFLNPLTETLFTALEHLDPRVTDEINSKINETFGRGDRCSLDTVASFKGPTC